MKYTLHIPVEQYGFVEAEYEGMSTDPDEARDFYETIKATFKVGEGISDKEFNAVVDAMMRGESIKNGTEIWPRMSESQQNVCQNIKRSMKRINSKLKKENNK